MGEDERRTFWLDDREVTINIESSEIATKPLTIDQITSITRSDFERFEDAYAFYYGRAEEAYRRKKEKERNENMNGDRIEKREYLDFKEGDLVRIRSWEDMERQYGTNYGGDINTHFYFTPEMKQFCGKEYIVTERYYNGKVGLRPKSHKFSTTYYSVSADMIEIVEENYVENRKKEAKPVEIETNQDIIQEMISKVDKNKLLRIFAGSFNMNLKEIHGVDKLLEQWAKAKAELYIILGNQLKIEKEIEYEKSGEEIKREAVELADQFPIFKYIAECIPTGDYETNTYTYTLTCGDGISRNNKRYEIIKSIKYDDE